MIAGRFDASEFGSTFAVPVKLEGRLHQTSRTVSRNWLPVAMVHGLHIMAASITNIVDGAQRSSPVLLAEFPQVAGSG